MWFAIVSILFLHFLVLAVVLVWWRRMLTLSFGEKQFHWYLSYYCSSQAKDAESRKGRAKYENLKASDILEDMRNFLLFIPECDFLLSLTLCFSASTFRFHAFLSLSFPPPTFLSSSSILRKKASRLLFLKFFCFQSLLLFPFLVVELILSCPLLCGLYCRWFRSLERACL